MPTYIGKIKVGSDLTPIGSTLYAICSTAAATAAKVATLAAFDTRMADVTVPVKFTQGNSVVSGVTLTIGNVQAPVAGNCVCSEGDILTFTYEDSENENERKWRCHGSSIRTALAAINQSLGNIDSTMHFIGVSSTAIVNGGTTNPTINGTVITTKTAGDVVIYEHEEYVWNGSAWQLLGDESSYLMDSAVQNVEVLTSTTSFSQGTLPLLNIDDTTMVTGIAATEGNDPGQLVTNLTTSTYTMPTITGDANKTTATVSGGILEISVGSDITVTNPNAGNTVTGVNTITKGNLSTTTVQWSQGTLPSFTPNVDNALKKIVTQQNGG